MIGGLRTRLLLLALVPLLPVLVLAFVNAQRTRADSLDRVRNDMRSLAHLAASFVELRVDSTRERLDALGDSPDVAAGDARCVRVLRDEVRRAPANQNLLAADAAGRVTCAARAPARPGRPVGAAPWFEALRGGAPMALGSAPAGAISPRPALVVAARRGGLGGGFTGGVAAALDLRLFDRLAPSIDLPRRASLVVLGPGGVLLARYPVRPDLIGRAIGDTPLGAAARRGARSAEVVGLDGVRRVYGFARVGSGPEAVVVATGLARDEVGASADRTLRRTLLVLGLVALLVVPAALLVAHLLIARPIRGDAAARQSEIDRSLRERQRLLAELVAAEEEERKRIAGDIHDDSLQALAALLLRLELLEARVDDEDVRARLAEARESTRTAVARLRHMLFQLTPPALETAGLAPALEEYLEEIGRVWGRETSVRSSLDAEPAPEPRSLAYRIAVEAVNNAAKHAGDGRIDLTLESLDGGVRVRVADDGVGFEVGAPPERGHLGMRSMRERAEAAGGWWRVDSAPGRGTTVEFFVPGG